MRLELEDVNEEEQKFLLEVQRRCEKLRADAREVAEWIDKQTDWKDGPMKDLPGTLQTPYIAFTDWGYLADQTKVDLDELWEASDQFC